MPNRTSRRAFLVTNARTALGLSVLPLAACSRPPDPASEPGPDVPAALITLLEAHIPALLSAAHVPGLSIAIVGNGRMAWARGFGVKHSISKGPVDTDTLILTNGDNGTEVIGKLAEGETPLNHFVTG
jgi:CubicO group peptidase (beta-lactamase class C family)